MGTSLFGSFRSTAANGVAGSTVYWTAGNDAMGNGSVPVTESFSQIPYRTAGRFAKLTCIVNNNDRTTSTMITRTAGGAGTESVSITGSATGVFSDQTHVDSVAGTGDTWNLATTYGTGGTVCAISGKSLQFTPSLASQTLSKFAYSNPTSASNVTAASTTYFFTPTGVGTNGLTSETNIPIAVKTSGILSKLSTHVSTNTSAAAVTVTSRKNSGVGGLTLSITASTTGLFEDTSNSQTMVSGDTFDYAATSGAGTTATTIDFIASEFVTTNGLQQVLSGGTANALAANTTRFIGMGNLGAATTEPAGQNTIYSPCFVTQLSINVSANTVTAASTGTFRITSANGVNTFSVGSGATGSFSDSTHSDRVAATNLVDFQMVTGATGTTLTLASIGYLMQQIPTSVTFFGAGI